MADHLKYDDYIREKLTDAEYARGYLEVALEEAEADGNYAAFLMALRRVAEARSGNMDKSSAISPDPTSFFKTLAEEGSPTMESLGAILHSLGMRLSLTRQEPVS